MKISGEKLKFERVIRRMTQEELGERLGGIQKTNISLWENGAKDVPLKYYKELEELFGRGIFEEEFSGEKDGVRFLKKEDFVAVPTLTVAQAMEITPQNHPFGNSLAAFIEDTPPSYFSTAKPGDFAVIVSGSSMEPWYPQGTRLLVGRDEIPKTGQRVIANIADHSEPVFKIFVDVDTERFALLSINDKEGCKPIILNKMSRGEWHWVWPIKASIRYENDVDAAMKKHGIHHFWEKWLEDKKNEMS